MKNNVLSVKRKPAVMSVIVKTLIFSTAFMILIVIGNIMVNTPPRNAKYGCTYFMGICLEDHMIKYDYKAKTRVKSSPSDMLTEEDISAATAMYAEQMIQSTAQKYEIDAADLKISDIRFNAVHVNRYGNKISHNVFGYIYNKISGEVLGTIEFVGHNDGTVGCNMRYLSENNGVSQAFAEHPGENLVCVYVGDILYGVGEYVLLAEDNTVYSYHGGTNFSGAGVFASGTDYYTALNIGSNVVNSNIIE